MIGEEEIQRFVHGFYARIREHEELGPIFARKIAEGAWPQHLERMCDFWSSTLLASRRYHGNPRLKHVGLEGLRAEHFPMWLDLFESVLREQLAPPAVDAVMHRARKMGARLSAAAGLTPGGLSIGLPHPE